MDNDEQPEIVQAKWTLGGILPEDLSEFAVIALQRGFDGTALRQLAGLSRPTLADLENLPEKAFLDLGLKPLDKDAAAALLISRGIPPLHPILSTLLDAFPAFAPFWKKHVAYWGGEPAGNFTDMSVFVHFTIEELFEKGKEDEVQRLFQLLEKLLLNGDQETTGLIGIGFFEKLQNISSWRPYGNKVFERYLGPRSAAIWQEIRRIWAGKSSLAEVIRAEQKAK
jgi:hypothetical protein